ncbi:putative WD domain, G-beta repeat [Lyophyllum shimeji]|uniref:WD domain, G-beta repeat n=1 Tax=Lyophyllum shimeji TaxID=47721 RepID=A0A9P3PGM3_LYOSH|nr:putative WD domain, G-beta repeat [Lyophyllum shimeji]
MASDTSNFLVAEAQLVLDEARRQKSERIKTLGSPIQLPGKALYIQVRGNYAWVAENTTVTRKLDLESGKTVQLYKGHTGPVTTLAFCDRSLVSRDEKILITGSWDRTIKLWDTDTKELLSSTSDAHGDFVKCLFVFPSLELLVSSGSDKIVRFWDLSTPQQRDSLRSMGSISSHTRPVECLAGEVLSPTSAILYTADTMGVIKSWLLTKEDGPSPRWRSTLQDELKHHRTRINEMLYGNGQLWTASADETVQVLYRDSTATPPRKPAAPICHPVAVRSTLPLALTELAEPYLITGAGDMLRVYDVSTAEEPELVRELDAHWHDVTAIRLWKRETAGDDGRTRVEPWVVSTSLDGTIRKWRLSELLTPAPPAEPKAALPPSKAAQANVFEMTEDEERELAELMDSD